MDIIDKIAKMDYEDIVYILENNDINCDVILCLCGKYGRTDVAKYLVELGYDPSIFNSAPARLAYEYDNIDVFKYLIKNGAKMSDVFNLRNIFESAIYTGN